MQSTRMQFINIGIVNLIEPLLPSENYLDQCRRKISENSYRQKQNDIKEHARAAYRIFCDTVIEIKDAWFRYEKNLPDVVKGFNLRVNKGELFCLVSCLYFTLP